MTSTYLNQAQSEPQLVGFIFNQSQNNITEQILKSEISRTGKRFYCVNLVIAVLSFLSIVV